MRDTDPSDEGVPAVTTIDFEGDAPQVPATAWVAPNATLIGKVTLRENSSVFYSSVLRGDMDSITIGPGSNIQDGCVIHTDEGFPAVVGSGVSVGHRAVLHGCTVEDDSLIGMGAVVLNGAVVGAGSLVAAGAVVTEGMQIPPGSLVAGVPAKVRRELDEEALESLRQNARTYVELAAKHRAAMAG
ncbi:MAG: gamma carbonic anhydrase family protein [Brachybacterium sp.]|uniref:gamma carbonic anhydrase family protein n=1 Tax=unclassified Brachybacterium TaxID=2623841 RepID=UPI003F951674